MKITGIPFVGYPVTDVERSKAFYEGVLGLTCTMDEGIGGADDKRWIEFDIGSETLAISNAWPPSGQPGPSAALEVDDLDVAFEELKAANAEIVYGPIASPVCRQFGIKDPDGNDLTIHQSNPAPSPQD